MQIINTETTQPNDGQSVSPLTQRYELMPINGRSYVPQNQIQRSERDGGHKVKAMIHKFESLVQNQSPERIYGQRVSDSRQSFCRIH